MAWHEETSLRRRYDALSDAGQGGRDAESIGRRRLRNPIPSYLAALEQGRAITTIAAHYDNATDMRDPALSLLAGSQADEAQQRLNDCYQRWRDEPLVVDKWLGVQAPSQRVDTRQRVRRPPRLVRPQNPNKVRTLLSTFANAHPIRFHDASGPGYRFIADQVMAFR